MLLAFCNACSLAPAEVAMVGDNLHEHGDGRNAGAGWRIGVLTGTGNAGHARPGQSSRS